MGLSLLHAMEKVIQQVDLQKPALKKSSAASHFNLPFSVDHLLDNPVFASLLKQLQEARAVYTELQDSMGADAPITLIAADRVESLLSAIQTIWLEQVALPSSQRVDRVFNDGVPFIVLDDLLALSLRDKARHDKETENYFVMERMRRERAAAEKKLDNMTMLFFLHWSLQAEYEWSGPKIKQSFDAAAFDAAA